MLASTDIATDIATDILVLVCACVNPRSYITEGDYILYDCGLGNGVYKNLFLCPKGGWKNPPDQMQARALNSRIRSSRCLVENTYSRIKRKWAILIGWSRSLSVIGKVFYTAVALTNIDIVYNSPLRRKTCTRGCNCMISRAVRTPVRLPDRSILQLPTD